VQLLQHVGREQGTQLGIGLADLRRDLGVQARALGRELHQDLAAIRLILHALHQAAGFHPRDDARHARHGDHGGLAELGHIDRSHLGQWLDNPPVLVRQRMAAEDRPEEQPHRATQAQ
jgi:hypothetical protein